MNYNNQYTNELEGILKSIIKECEEWIIPSSETSNNCENNHYVDIDDLKALINKAKLTLNENDALLKFKAEHIVLSSSSQEVMTKLHKELHQDTSNK